MARKPNYRFDRQEKDRAKAAKKAERLKAKQDRSNKRQSSADTGEPELAEAEAEAETGEARSDGPTAVAADTPAR